MFKTVGLGVSTLVAAGMLVAQANASALMSTDRFGYTGTVTRYATEQDARAGANAQGVVQIGNRDASIYLSGAENTIMGSWWYTTQGSAGYGNTTGNTGVGFMQIYDSNGSTDTSSSMGFQNRDLSTGVWTEFYAHVAGANATAASDVARFSVYDNVHDAGTYLEYAIDLVATGLQGTESGGLITATDHPDGVTGSFYGLFVFGGDAQGYPDGVGPDGWATSYYVIDLDLNMVNWAYTKGLEGQLNGPYQEEGAIYASLFQQTVPEPATLALMGLGLAGMGMIRRRRAA